MTWSIVPRYPVRQGLRMAELARDLAETTYGPAQVAAAVRCHRRRYPTCRRGLVEPDDIDIQRPLLTIAALDEAPDGWVLAQRSSGPRPQVRTATADEASGLLAGPGVAPDTTAQVAPQRPGRTEVVRREHACVEVRSPAGASVLLDPIAASAALANGQPALALDEHVDAVLVTHSHADHFDLRSLAWASRHATTVVLPETPHTGVLCEPMHDLCNAARIPTRTLGWGQRLVARDMRITALPFAGEQPASIAAPAVPQARNWGNCYRIDTPDLAAVFLVDAGTDPWLDAVAVVERSVQDDGPIDAVFSCCRAFLSPFEVEGLAPALGTLALDELQALHTRYRSGTLPPATLGPAGLARLAHRTHIAWVFPYAHGYCGPGRAVAANPFGPGPGASESDIVVALRARLCTTNAPTEVGAWAPGDVLTWHQHTMGGIEPHGT